VDKEGAVTDVKVSGNSNCLLIFFLYLLTKFLHRFRFNGKL